MTSDRPRSRRYIAYAIAVPIATFALYTLWQAIAIIHCNQTLTKAGLSAAGTPSPLADWIHNTFGITLPSRTTTITIDYPPTDEQIAAVSECASITFLVLRGEWDSISISRLEPLIATQSNGWTRGSIKTIATVRTNLDGDSLQMLCRMNGLKVLYAHESHVQEFDSKWSSTTTIQILSLADSLLADRGMIQFSIDRLRHDLIDPRVQRDG